MAEQMASDPSFQAITQQLAGMGLAPGAMAGMPGAPGALPGAPVAEPIESSADSTAASGTERALPAAGAGAGALAGMPPGGVPGPGVGGMPVDPEQYMKARFPFLFVPVACSCPTHSLRCLQPRACDDHQFGLHLRSGNILFLFLALMPALVSGMHHI